MKTLRFATVAFIALMILPFSSFSQGKEVQEKTKKEVAKEIKDNPKYYRSFDEAMETPEEVTKLVIAFSEEPERIFELLMMCRNIQYLELPGCRLNEFPEMIFELQGLEYLFLDYNEIADIPPAIEMLSNLKVISLKHNGITRLPDTITNLKQLELLMLNGNEIPEEELQRIQEQLPSCKILY